MSSRLDLTSLEKALVSFDQAISFATDEAMLAHQPSGLRETLVAAAIKNFEFVHELCVKMIRRQLEAEALDPSEIDQDNYRTILRIAAKRGLIADPEAWFDYRAKRNITSHIYNKEQAKVIFDVSRAFYQDALLLLERLRARNA